MADDWRWPLAMALGDALGLLSSAADCLGDAVLAERGFEQQQDLKAAVAHLERVRAAVQSSRRALDTRFPQ